MFLHSSMELLFLMLHLLEVIFVLHRSKQFQCSNWSLNVSKVLRWAKTFDGTNSPMLEFLGVDLYLDWFLEHSIQVFIDLRWYLLDFIFLNFVAPTVSKSLLVSKAQAFSKCLLRSLVVPVAMERFRLLVI